MNKFSNVTVGDKVVVKFKNFAPSTGTVVKVFKNHFKVSLDISYYTFKFDGSIREKTFFTFDSIEFA